MRAKAYFYTLETTLEDYNNQTLEKACGTSNQPTEIILRKDKINISQTLDITPWDSQKSHQPRRQPREGKDVMLTKKHKKNHPAMDKVTRATVAIPSANYTRQSTRQPSEIWRCYSVHGPIFPNLEKSKIGVIT